MRMADMMDWCERSFCALPRAQCEKVSVCCVPIDSKTRLARSAVKAEPLSERKASGAPKVPTTRSISLDTTSAADCVTRGTRIMKPVNSSTHTRRCR